MQTLITGIYNRTGTAKATGNAYDMSKILALRELRSNSSEKSNFKAFGYQQAEFDCTKELVNELSAKKFPLKAELIFETQFTAFGQPIAVVVGIKE